MEICFADDKDGCVKKDKITVTNCDEFYIYYLVDTVGCMLRYCANNYIN